MQDRIVRFVTGHSRVAESYLRRMMSRTDQMANDIGSIVDGAEAVRCGLIDRIGGLSDALSCLRELAAKKSKEKGAKALAKDGVDVVE
jgi:ATP-dependent protease ClpP protease subunit